MKADYNGASTTSPTPLRNLIGEMQRSGTTGGSAVRGQDPPSNFPTPADSTRRLRAQSDGQAGLDRNLRRSQDLSPRLDNLMLRGTLGSSLTRPRQEQASQNGSSGPHHRSASTGTSATTISLGTNSRSSFYPNPQRNIEPDVGLGPRIHTPPRVLLSTRPRSPVPPPMRPLRSPASIASAQTSPPEAAPVGSAGAVWGKPSKKASLEDDVPGKDEEEFVGGADPPPGTNHGAFLNGDGGWDTSKLPGTGGVDSSSAAAAAANPRTGAAGGGLRGRSRPGALASSSASMANSTVSSSPVIRDVVGTSSPSDAAASPGTSASAADATAPNAGMLYEDAFKTAIAETREEQQRALGISPKEIDEVRSNARTIRDIVDGGSMDYDFLKSMLQFCHDDHRKIKSTISSFDGPTTELQELLDLIDIVDHAIQAGEGANQPHQETPQVPSPQQSAKSALEVEPLVKKKDIFSLICILRANQAGRRLEASLALMRFGREAEKSGDMESLRLRDEIRSSGGLNSLLTLFRASQSTYEIRVVSALAVAYLLPSYLESSSETPATLALKIVECLGFLSSCNSVTAKGECITVSETFEMAASGLASFWINHLQPSLQSERSRGKNGDSSAAMPLGRTLSRGRKKPSGGVGIVLEQKQDAIARQELLEMTVALIVQLTSKSDNEPSSDTTFIQRYTLVEQVCAVETARPIAVREGILQILVSWIRSQNRDKVRPAASALLDLTSINDRYMAGWIHSQMINKGAVQGLADLTRDINAGHDVRLAIAKILSSLCVAPHTRAAVVEANCISFLIGFLYEHSDVASEDVALFAGRALVQLAAGAITRANVLNSEDFDGLGFASPDKSDTLIDDIVQGGAIAPLVDIALKHDNELRIVAVEALRVLSEDISPIRQTRLRLCEDGAARALGTTLKEGVSLLVSVMSKGGTVSSAPERVLKELQESLCALANVLDPIHEGQMPQHVRQTTNMRDPTSDLIRGCLDTAKSGGLEALLEIASLPMLPQNGSSEKDPTMELLEEACRSLASMSPLLLTDESAKAGVAYWAHDVLSALHHVLEQLFEDHDQEMNGIAAPEFRVIVLQGLAALARSDPLKVRIIDKSLPRLLQAKSVRDRTEISSAAAHAFQSLDFTEEEVAVNVAGNNPTILADWFCLERSLLIQAMARTEMQRTLVAQWEEAFRSTQHDSLTRLIRSISETSRGDDVPNELFYNFADDSESTKVREALLRQYADIYDNRQPRDTPRLRISRYASEQGSEGEPGLLAPQVYPLNDSNTETDWILHHRHFLSQTVGYNESSAFSEHVERFLGYCFPSRLFRDQILPMRILRPDASFNFRAFMMPQRLYFSFRREGQLLSHLCDREAAGLDAQDVHWTLSFTNSSFGGEFAESLVQALYRCPMIRGLSFARDADWPKIRDMDKENKEAERGILANLAGSLPPWIASLTFDGVLDDMDLRTLVAILETMGELAAGHQVEGAKEPSSSTHAQGKFSFFAIRRSPGLPAGTWSSFMTLLGKKGSEGPQPLASLTSLDLSGNDLGDELCSYILDLVCTKNSVCTLEELDLSSNRIQTGMRVMEVLRHHMDRYDRLSSMKGSGKNWKSSLHTLRLASNSLHLGKVWLQMIALLTRDGLEIKTLDLSSNELALTENESDLTDVFVRSLKTSSLGHLNLSNNKFSAGALDSIISKLNSGENKSCLSFLLFENNVPELTSEQKDCLSSFLRRARVNAIEKVTDLSMQQEEENEGEIVPTPRPRTQLSISEMPPSIEDALPGNNSITVLFSAPLVYNDGRQLRPFAKLDFDMERELMWQCLSEASRDIDLFFDNATFDRLLATMAKRCSCLHYSGHGHKNYLPFEDGEGGPYWFKVDQFKDLIAREGTAPFRFVFVSACYSGLAGKTFASAGVPHVVCCQQESELKDTAALAFTRQFYLALAVGHTVRDSFEQGCKAVRATPNLKDPEKEMRKFMLLPEDGNHEVPIFKARRVAEWPKPVNDGLAVRNNPRHRRRSEYSRVSSTPNLGPLGSARTSHLSVRGMMQEDPSPSPPQFFLGREVDMYVVLQAILKKNLVSVVGEAGMGRSSLVCALCHYINERASTILAIDRIYYVKVQSNRKKNRLQKLAKKLLGKLAEEGKAPMLESDADIEEMIDAICRSLKGMKALIVFDRVEYLQDAESNEFPMLLSRLARDTRHVKVLLTNRRTLGIPSLGEHIISLGPLNFASTVRLFSNLCPYLHSSQDRRRLFKNLASDQAEAELFMTDPGLRESTKQLFAKLGEGIPSRVENAAFAIPKDEVMEMMNERLRTAF